jgi:MFS family permease
MSMQKETGRGAMAALSLSMLLASMGVSIANIALPALAESFGATFPQVQWVTIAYLLTVTTLVVSAGGLGDRLGHVRVLTAGLALFTAASAACAMAPALPVLIAARMVQGIGGAVLMAVTVALVRDAVPAERTGRAMGLLGTMSAIGTALGPSLGGALIGGFGWRAVFWVLVPIGVVALALTGRFLRGGSRARPEDAGTFDAIGTVLLGMSLAAYTLAVTAGGAAGIVLWVMAIGGMALFVPLQLRSATPLVPLRALRDRALAAGLGINLLVATVMMSTLVVGPVFLTRGLGLPMAVAGAVMTVGPVVSSLSGVPSGRLVDRFGSWQVLVAGLAVMGCGVLGLALLPGAFGVAGFVAAIALLTPGYQMVQAANTTRVMVGAAPDQRGVMSGLLNLSRNLGLVTGASVLGAVFAFAAGGADVTVAAAPEVGAALRLTFLAALALVGVGMALALTARPVAAVAA